MRCGYLFGALALGSLVIVTVTPEPAQGCHLLRCLCGHGHGYSAPMPACYPAPGPYMVAPGYPQPGMYYAPGMGPAPGMTPSPRPMPAPPPATAAKVSATDNRFEPAALNVQVGATVQWVNNGQHPHTVTSNDGKWDSGNLQPGATYSVTFTTPGTYRYHCNLHKGMEGTIVVGEPGKAPVGGGAGPKGPSYAK